MDKQHIINALHRHKKQPYLDYRIKTKTEQFTDTLFYTLFDINTPVEENLEHLGVLFNDLVDLACWETAKLCRQVWERYVASLPSILENLNLDAEAIKNCDPASISIEEV